ncbi:MAG: CBS domain-containing protein [Bacilli bacterium]
MNLSKEIEGVVIPKDKVVTVQPSMNLDDALKTLIDSKYSAVPVVNDKGLYVGTVSKTNILSLVTHGKTVHYHHLKDRFVYDASTELIPTLPIDSTFKQLMSHMITHPFITLLGEDSQFYGIATRQLVLKQVMNQSE